MPVTINGNGTITPTSAIQPTGSVLQVVSAFKDDTASIAGGDNTQREFSTDLRANITPASTSSKVLVNCSLSLSAVSNIITFKLLRTIGSTTTEIANHTDASTVWHGCAGWWQNDEAYWTQINFSFLDSPNTTSQVTYSPSGASGVTMWLNRIYNQATYTGTSSVTATEIAG